jgi:transposase
MGKELSQYTKEFKQEAIKLVVERGRAAVEVARELGVKVSTLYTWVDKYKKHGQNAFPGKGYLMPQDEKMRRLEKELKEVTMERDILKKAMAVFSRHQK